MKAFGLVLRCLSALLLLSSLVEAWSWSDEVEGLIYGHGEVLKKRASDASSESAAKETAAASATATASGGAASASATGTITDAASGTAAASATGTASGTQATTGSNTKSASGTKKTSSSTTSIDARLPEGGISMITPAASAYSSYYKIGNYITFAWNYTSLSVTPSAIDILASCSANDQYYTIALNETVHDTNTVVWDTGDFQASATIPLLTETYTLVIHDAAKDVTATAGPGYLGTYDSWTFGMYSPQAYTPLNEFTCATCSAALSLAERQALGLVVVMGSLTVLSFTIFAGGFGVFS